MKIMGLISEETCLKVAADPGSTFVSPLSSLKVEVQKSVLQRSFACPWRSQMVGFSLVLESTAKVMQAVSRQTDTSEWSS